MGDHDDVRRFMADPTEWFGRSLTAMHSMPRKELDDLLKEAMAVRFVDHRESIDAVGKAAERAGVTELRELDDVVPLLFAHAAYKSYPAALLDRKRYDQLTRWLDKLTSHDLSHVDVTGCTDIDSSIDALDEQTPLEVITSSGTTGTLSIIPKDKAGAEVNMRNWRVLYFQTFGVEPRPEDLDPQVDVIWPNFSSGKLGHLRMAAMFRRWFTGGDESRFHALYGDAVSTDLMFLASKLRAAAAAASSTASRSTRRCWPARPSSRSSRPACRTTWRGSSSRSCGELAGRRVFVMGSYNLLHELATEGLSRGISGVFAPDSVVASGGGAKGIVLPDNWQEPVLEFFGVDRIVMGYGMSEVSAMHVAVRAGPLPRAALDHPLRARPRHERAGAPDGRATGPGRVLRPGQRQPLGRGDVGRRDRARSRTPCGCGRTTVHIGPRTSSATATSRGTTASPPRPPSSSSTRPSTSCGDRVVSRAPFDVPLVVRGEVIEGDWVEFGGRTSGIEFRAPDPALHVDRLPARPRPMAMADLHALRLRRHRRLPRRPRPPPRPRHQPLRPAGLRRRPPHLRAHRAAPATRTTPSLPVLVRPDLRPRDGRADDRRRPPRGLGGADARRRPPAAHPGLRRPGGARRGRQQPGARRACRLSATR